MKINRKIKRILVLLLYISLFTLNACEYDNTILAISTPVPPPAQPSQTQPTALTKDQIASLESLEKVDDYPLYSMHYYANYESVETLSENGTIRLGIEDLLDRDQDREIGWGCSLFAAFGNAEHPVFGRNFDWRYSPAMLLYTYPKSGNASVSMVDLEYLFGDQATDLMALSTDQRLPLLNAPAWPFDGMNACGLVIGMAAVPTSAEIQDDPDKTDIDSLGIMRVILDHACTVEEAVGLLNDYNISWEGGPELHYLIAESSGRAVLVEYLRGSMQVIPNQDPWHQATNFLLSSGGEYPLGVCDRYDAIAGFMQDTFGQLSAQQALSLLTQVSQDSTQWSTVYDLISGEINVVMGGNYQHPHTFQLDMNP